MHLADNKFKILKVKEVWNAPIKEEENIIALEAFLEKLNKGNPKVEVKNENINGKKKNMDKFNDEIKYKPYWMSKRPSESQINNPKTWNGGTWYYCHRDTGSKCDGQCHKHRPS